MMLSLRKNESLKEGLADPSFKKILRLDASVDDFWSCLFELLA